MREESRSATDALASAVEGVRRPRSIIRIVAVNYFSPALILLGKMPKNVFVLVLPPLSRLLMTSLLQRVFGITVAVAATN
ncbi:uncharacterized protein DS421_16g543500 [Arachis hypogaea]|nr:uncharacterized protein DS421_16g543500 [Arachis hypogaea]